MPAMNNNRLIASLVMLAMTALIMQSANDKHFAYSFNIESATIVQKNTNVLGVDVSFAMIDVTFDRDLYIHKASACPNFTCPTQPAINCACDYTDPAECPKKLDASCPACPASKNGVVFCSPDSPWTTLQANQTYTFSNITSAKSFRYKPITSYCEGFKVHISQEYGDMVLYEGTDRTPLARYTGLEYIDQELSMNICPTDNNMGPSRKSWTNGTYFFRVEPNSNSPLISYSITIYSAPVPAVDVNAPMCTNVTKRHRCVSDGVQMFGETTEDGVVDFYSFAVDRNMSLAIAIPYLGQAINFFISDDRYADDFRWAAVQPNENNGIIEVGPWPNGTARILYIQAYVSYACKYTFSLQSHATLWKIPITSGFPRGSSFSLYGSSRIVSPSEVFSTAMPGLAFTALAPRKYNNPLWPVPSDIRDLPFLATIDFFDTLYISEPSNVPKSRTYQASFLLSYNDQASGLIVKGTMETLLNSTLEFSSTIIDENGLPLTAILMLKEGNITCDYQEFNTLLDDIKLKESSIYSGNNYNEVSALRYELDAHTLRDPWYGCMSNANDLLKMEVLDKVELTTMCTLKPNDPKYLTDPCCDTSLQFSQCCIPRNITIPTLSIVGTKEASVKQQCSSYSCTTSVLDEYSLALASVNKGDCSLSQTEYNKYQLNVANTLRSCKDVYDWVYCVNDSMCADLGDNTKCNLYRRKCEPDRVSQDMMYLSCIINQSAPSTMNFLKYQLGLGQVQDDSVLIKDMYNMFLSNDCSTFTGNSYRKRYVYGTNDGNGDGCYTTTCFDDSCEVVHDTCHDGYISGYQFLPNFLTQDECAAKNICTSCDPTDDACKLACAANNYCGFCPNQHTTCYNFNNTLPDEPSCSNSQGVCLLPSGQYDSTMTEAQCHSAGTCSETCGATCGIYKGCVSPMITNQTECEKITNGTWRSTGKYGFCQVQIQSPGTCELRGHTYVNCNAQAVDECSNMVGGGKVELCGLTPIECTSKDDCEQTGGSCTDAFYFDEANLPQYPQGLGKCVHRHEAYTNSGRYTCKIIVENDSPMGCIKSSPDVFTEAECIATGGEWWRQAYSQTACEQNMGCLAPSTYSTLPNQFRFNEMNETQCNICQNNDNKWTNKFSWKAGRWMPGVMVKPKWLTTTRVNMTTWGPTFDFEKFANALQGANYGHLVNQMRSSAMCRMNRLQENLDSLACSCSGPGGAQCFGSSAILLGTTVACAEESSNFTFTNGRIMFTNQSVPISCVDVLVSQISKLLYKATVQISLSTDFVSYKKADSYSLTNGHGAIIGSILGDGIKVQHVGVDSYTVCLKQVGQPTSDFPILDFASQSVNDTKVLIPQNAEVFPLTLADGQVYLCANMSLTGEDTSTHFPIIRVADWSTAKKRLFDRSTTALIYTLGVLFGLNALWGFVQIGFIAIKLIRDKVRFKLVHGLIVSITTFITIRSIYFFILPSGQLSDSLVADYILVVLPTFLYFTAFSIIVVLWYVIVSSKIHVNFFSRFKQTIIVVNVIIYLIFIIIVLVFNFSKKTERNDCGARMSVIPSNTTPQRVVSIFYAVVQAVISLLIGASFVYLGVSIYKLVGSQNPNGQVKRSSFQKKIFIVASTCSVGFILHCVFVLILVGAEPSNIVFSFVGLIVTEIIPVMSILFAYNQGQLGGLRRSTGSNASNRMTNISGTRSTHIGALDTSNNSNHHTRDSSDGGSLH
ncbi:hypothetical protein SAMD00019534_122910 [Acytostelium subglobosum LB1]|uniref:hypothetical protein n=1 Tax=Acytostelium subglobosum LB1 TaxID=1410327 RepID=UPI000644E8D6|nr:hypothetical protein SAMD00019534_122910 [Acytostelium subglobosum LB1]GAM29115.1 hypothetical protein SAMD00019534_122910 [Acytostelium subglobosum LB1]|eukprot:XP_012747960.1 hypothetical protein SAMD00019534_122910 [Acytostelium subglobosum LB1]